MKHVIKDDIDVNVRVDIPAEDLSDLIDQVRDAAVTVIVVASAAHIFRKWVT